MLVSELRKLAKNNGIKYYAKYSKEKLAEIFDIDVSNDKKSIPVQVVNLDTNDIKEFQSIYKCSKMIGKKQGSLSYFLKSGNCFKIDGISYKIENI